MNEQLFTQALAAVQARRMAAAAEQQRRFDEIGGKIPQIAEINAQLATTSTRLFEVMQDGRDVEARLESLKNENLEAQRIISQLLVQNGYPADYMELHYQCGRCNDTGYCGGVYCECLKKEIASAAIRKMNENAQLKLATFEQFSLDYYKGLTSEQGEDCYAVMRRIFAACKRYAQNFTPDAPSLLFYGRSGLGKTHLSLAVAHDVIAKGYDVIYDSIINLLERVEREHFGRTQDGDSGNTLEVLLHVDLLILDDLGTEFTSPFYVSVIYNLINTRLNRGKPTIISTNLDHAELRRRYEERILSRLFAAYEPLHFIGTDIRLQKKKQRNPLV